MWSPRGSAHSCRNPTARTGLGLDISRPGSLERHCQGLGVGLRGWPWSADATPPAPARGARGPPRSPVRPSPGSTPRTAMSGGHGVSWPRHSPRFLKRLFPAELFRVEIHMQFTEPQFYAHCKSRPQAPATELPDPPTFPLPGCDQPVGPLTPPVTHVYRLGALLFLQKSRVRG